MIVQVFVCVLFACFAEFLQPSILHRFMMVILSIIKQKVVVKQNFLINYNVFRRFKMIRMVNPMFLALSSLLNDAIFYVVTLIVENVKKNKTNF